MKANINNTKLNVCKSIANGGKNENADIQQKINGCIPSEDTVKVIQVFEQLIKNKKNDILWLAYYQDQIFQKLKEKESFVSMVLKLDVSKSTIIFKIAFKKID